MVLSMQQEKALLLAYLRRGEKGGSGKEQGESRRFREFEGDIPICTGVAELMSLIDDYCRECSVRGNKFFV